MPEDKPYTLPNVSREVIAAFKEDLNQHKIDTTLGDTDLPFDSWLKSQRPQRWPLWLKATGQGK